jgi:hypothetical protein
MQLISGSSGIYFKNSEDLPEGFQSLVPATYQEAQEFILRIQKICLKGSKA